MLIRRVKYSLVSLKSLCVASGTGTVYITGSCKSVGVNVNVYLPRYLIDLRDEALVLAGGILTVYQ